MSISNNAIETLSVSAVRDSIAVCDFLQPYIADNDKEPSWDGGIYIYKDKDCKKGSLKGRVPVQIKGKRCNVLSNEKISYPMKIDDLRNYLYDGGAMLFVVYVNDSGQDKTIYYISLTPLKLKKILEEVGSQNTKNLKLKKFPIDNKRKEDIFFNCLQHCQKQASFAEAKLYPLEELIAQGVLESLSIPIYSYEKRDLFHLLNTDETYIYANIKGSPIPQPLELLPKNIKMIENCMLNISINEIIYYTKIQIHRSIDRIIWKLGESISLTFPDESSNTVTINYVTSTKARILAKDLDFLLSAIEAEHFKVNDSLVSFKRDELILTNLDLEVAKRQLTLSKNVVEVLDLLNCHEDVDFKSLKAADFKLLDLLITALVFKKPLENLSDGQSPIVKISVGKLAFALNLQVCEGVSGKYNAYDFFKTEMSLVYEFDNGQMLPISQYAILDADDLLTLNNVRFDILLPSFQKIQKHHDLCNRANWFLLELLNAYDKSNGTREEIVNTAQDFSKWLLDEAIDEELSYNIRLLNYLQTVKRVRELNENELSDLYSLIENSVQDEEILVGAYLLLGQQKSARKHFEKLPLDIQDGFKTYPIYHFWKDE